MERVKNNKTIITVIVVAAFFGLAGGVVGELFARAYLLESLFNLPIYGDINLSSATAGSNLIIRQASRVVVNENDKIDETINSMRSSLVGIYKKQNPVEDGNFSAVNYYSAREPAGQGLVLTGDGWLVTNFSLSDRAADFAQFAVVTNEKKVYGIDRVVKDKYSKMVFLHVPARDLSVKKFADRLALKNGELVLAASWQGAGWTSTVENREQFSAANSSDLPTDRIALKDAVPAFAAPVIFNLSGEVIGLMDSEQKIEPMSHFITAIDSLFRLKTIKRPSLGFYYLPAAALVPVSEKIKTFAGDAAGDKGVVIYKDGKTAAVAKGSAADFAGLKEGDVLLSLDEVDLDSGHNPNDILQTTAVGDTITAAILRNGEKKDLEIKIGELK